MALTFTNVKGTEWEAGRIRGRTYDVQFDASYLTGGEPMTPDDVGLLSITGAYFLGARTAAGVPGCRDAGEAEVRHRQGRDLPPADRRAAGRARDDHRGERATGRDGPREAGGREAGSAGRRGE